MIKFKKRKLEMTNGTTFSTPDKRKGRSIDLRRRRFGLLKSNRKKLNGKLNTVLRVTVTLIMKLRAVSG
jgi:hypothetical protein